MPFSLARKEATELDVKRVAAFAYANLPAGARESVLDDAIPPDSSWRRQVRAFAKFFDALGPETIARYEALPGVRQVRPSALPNSAMVLAATTALAQGATPAEAACVLAGVEGPLVPAVPSQSIYSRAYDGAETVELLRTAFASPARGATPRTEEAYAYARLSAMERAAMLDRTYPTGSPWRRQFTAFAAFVDAIGLDVIAAYDELPGTRPVRVSGLPPAANVHAAKRVKAAGGSIAEIAAALAVSDGPDCDVDPAETWTAEEATESLREAAIYQFPLTMRSYDELVAINQVTGPTGQQVVRLLGSWSVACSLAGVVNGGRLLATPQTESKPSTPAPTLSKSADAPRSRTCCDDQTSTLDTDFEWDFAGLPPAESADASTVKEHVAAGQRASRRAEVVPPTTPPRVAEMIERRLRGVTLDEIGAEFGVTRERVRQLLKKHGGPSAQEIRELRAATALAAQRAREEAVTGAVREALAGRGPMTVAEVAEATGLDADAISQHWPQELAHLRLWGAGQGESRWTDEDICEALRQASAYEFPLTTTAYSKLLQVGQVDGPSVPRIGQRFGSWSAACAAAGVVAGDPWNREYESKWSDEDLLQIAHAYLIDPNVPSSAHRFDDWKREHAPDGPSAQTLRNRFGSWTDVKRRALAQGGPTT